MRTPRRPALNRRLHPVGLSSASVLVGALVLSLLVGQVPAGAVSVAPTAAARPAGVSDVRIGLIRLAGALVAAAQQPALSEDLPLTDTSVRDVLSLDTAIGTVIDDTLETQPDTTLSTLDEAFATGPVVIKEVASPADAPKDSRDWTLGIKLDAARPVALVYPDDELQFGTAALGKDLKATLRTTIRFRYDPNEVALRRFAVVGSSTLTTHAWTDGGKPDAVGEQVSIPKFKLVDGFVELDAVGTATVDTTTVLALRDPNGRGQITTEDLEFSDAAELFTTTQAPGAGDVSMDIELSTPMSNQATGTITVPGATPVAPKPGAPTPAYAQPGFEASAALKQLSSLTRVQAMTGFTQYTSALQTVEGAAEQQFPLLDLSLTDLYSPEQKLRSLLSEQATATISCGAADTSPPSGAPRPGQVRYCQAVTSSFEAKAGTPISWTSPDADVSIDVPNAGAGTVGKSPTNNVAVSGGNGFPTLLVKFTNEDGAEYRARSAIASIQALGRAVDKLGLGGAVEYKADKRALEIAVGQSGSEAQTETVPTGGNGNLAPLTGLGGLCQAAEGLSPRRCLQTGDTADALSAPQPQEGQATVGTAGRFFRADLGIGLVDPAGQPTAGQTAPAEPTFYVRPDDDQRLYEVKSVTAKLAENAALVARIGFLQVDVDVTAYDLSQDASSAAASVSVPTSTVTLPSTETVDGVVTVASLLGGEADVAGAPKTPQVKLQVERGLKARATLGVQDSEQDEKDASGALLRPVRAQGTVRAAWSDLLPETLPTVSTEGDYDRLRLLDVVPTRQGTMGPATGGKTIADADADFLTQFGLKTSMSADERLVTRPLLDLGVPGSSSTICSQFRVENAHELTCTQGPLTTDGTVAPGHPYLITGDQDALRDILIEDLAAVQNSFTAPDPALGADRTFPLVDVLPGEISAARDALGVAVQGVQEQVTAETPEPGKPDTRMPVSTMQDFATTFGKLLSQGTTGTDKEKSRTLRFSLTQGTTSARSRLVLETGLETTGTRNAPLRVAVGASELKVIATTVGGKDQVASPKVDVASQAKYVVGVDLDDATSRVRADTGVSEQILKLSDNSANVAASLSGRDVDYGSARVRSGAANLVKLGIGVGANTGPTGPADNWIAVGDLTSQLTQQRVPVGAPQTCGTPEIAACLDLPLLEPADPGATPAPAPTSVMVKVALKADESSGGSGGALKPQPIAYRFLTDALGGLNLTLADALDGDQTLGEKGSPLSLPLIGTNLDAGADVPADVDRFVTAARSKLTEVEAVKESDPSSDLVAKLNAALVAAGVEVKGKNITVTAAPVKLSCTTDPCTGQTVDKVQQVLVDLKLEGALPAQKTPFQAGLAGAAIMSNRTVVTTTNWTLNVTVGIARGTGPFVQLATRPPIPCSRSTSSPAWPPATNSPATVTAGGSSTPGRRRARTIRRVRRSPT